MTHDCTELAALAQTAAQSALEFMKQWERDNPQTADYRAADGIYHLRRAIASLGHLHAGTHSAHYAAALEKARRRIA
ncbi:hypothetical protein ACQEVX_05445 [Streptomyces syringium]|uniref:hypothetical protein n=1 Tax=Streptomyces syringium TaxID=76729 RepID=UPI003D9317A3